MSRGMQLQRLVVTRRRSRQMAASRADGRVSSGDRREGERARGPVGETERESPGRGVPRGTEATDG